MWYIPTTAVQLSKDGRDQLNRITEKIQEIILATDSFSDYLQMFAEAFFFL